MILRSVSCGCLSILIPRDKCVRQECRVQEGAFFGGLLHTTKPPAFIFPAFTANTDGTPEDIRRVQSALDGEQTRIVAAVVSLLPVRLVDVALLARVSGNDIDLFEEGGRASFK